MNKRATPSARKIKFETVVYGVLASLAFAWLWNSKFVSGPNIVQAIGYDLASIGFPLVLLVAVSKNFLKSFRLWKSKAGTGALLFVLGATALLCGGWAVALLLALVGVGFMFGTRQRKESTVPQASNLA